jgi:hypothetical protein
MSDDNEATNNHNVTSNNSINEIPKKAPLPTHFQKEVPPPATEQKILTGVSIFLSVAGVIGFFLTQQVGIVVALNAPLLIVMAYYYPKR